MEPGRQSLPHKISYLATWDPSPIDCIFRVSPIFFQTPVSISVLTLIDERLISWLNCCNLRMGASFLNSCLPQCFLKMYTRSLKHCFQRLSLHEFFCVCVQTSRQRTLLSHHWINPLFPVRGAWGPHCNLTLYCVNTFVSPHRGWSKAVLPPHASFPQHQPHSRVLGSLIMWFAVLTLSILRVKQELLTRTLRRILTN